MKTLAEIREKTAYNSKAKLSLKQASRGFARSIIDHYPVALTLTLKQHSAVKNANGIFYKKLNSEECRKIAKRFMQKLNRAVFGKRGAEKYGKTLRYLVVVEGQRSHKNLHLHMAIGDLPKHVALNQLQALVCEAKKRVEQIDEQHDLSLADSGWIDYITKEVSKHDTDNVLWDLA